MHRPRLHQPDIAVNATARIPTGRVVGISETNRHDVLRSEFNIRRQIQTERSVAKRPAANKLPIEPNRRIRHRAVDIQINTLAAIRCRDWEMLSIPRNSHPGELAGFTRQLLLEWALYAPVVGKVELTPRMVVKCLLRIGYGFTQISFGTYRLGHGVIRKFHASRNQPGFDFRVVQLSLHFDGVTFLERPIRVEERSLAERFVRPGLQTDARYDYQRDKRANNERISFGDNHKKKSWAVFAAGKLRSGEDEKSSNQLPSGFWSETCGLVGILKSSIESG